MSITQTIYQAVQTAQHILLVTHVGPDGDALGSLVSMGLMLRGYGKQITLVCDSDIPPRFSFLPLLNQVRKRLEKSESYDLIIVVDCGDEIRMGRGYSDLPKSRPPLINIDHHVTNNLFGDVNHVDPTAASTCEMLYDLVEAWKVPLTADLALALLTGVVTDTLGFRTASTTAKSLKIAGSLVEAGGDLNLITMQTLNLKPMSTIKLWQIGLNHMRLEEGLMWVSITNDEREAIGHMSDSSSGLVNLLADIDRVAMSAVLLEMSDGTIRVGFRCRPPYQVSDLAASLGGGGHALAAGCTLEGPLSKAEAIVVESCKMAIHEQSVSLRNGYSRGN